LGPNINRRGIIGAPEYQLRRPVIPAADVADVRLPPDEGLRASEVAQLQLLILGIDEQVLRLDVAVAYPEGVDV
jgi:hypothetical protein